MNILKDLNPVQRDAVTYTDGPLLILAGAGSGKTRVLTYRVAYLIKEKKVNPHNVLAITFTNKAADEMKERIIKLVGKESQKLWISTFHAACSRILRQEIKALGYKKNFVVYDDRDSYRLISDCLKGLNIDSKQYVPSAILNQISLAKNELDDYEDYAERANTRFEEITASVYKTYQERLVKNNALDFDDLLVLTVRLFQMFSEILRKYQEKFKYILIDEYQDTNHAQYVLVKLLAEKYRNLCVVGDDDQSVYGWRGADIRNILEFEEDFPEARVVRLEQNYRSTQVILEAANYVISHNVRRKPKTLWTTNARGEVIAAYQAENEYDEAQFVGREIERIADLEKRSYRDFAVFYRTNAQSRVLEEIFLRHGIPYKIVGGVKFYERAEIKDIIAYLRVLLNPEDDISLKRIINTPRRSIGKTTLNYVEIFARREEIPLFEAVKRAEEITQLGKAALNALKNFNIMMEALKQKVTEASLREAVDLIANETGYLKALKEENTMEADSRIENIKELVSVASSFAQLYPDAGVPEFLERISLLSDIDTFNATEDAVTLMTIHNAKGLEFPVVFIVGMEEGLFPHSRSLYEESQVEEERRLCYVGITRAKERLYLSHAWRRTVWGTVVHSSPSRFINEIPEHLIQVPEFELTGKEGKVPTMPEAVVAFNVGDHVKHKHFGEGIVIDVQTRGKILVDFQDHGEKTLLLEYAPLEKV